MPESKLDPVITVDVNAAVKDSKVTAKVQTPSEKTPVTPPPVPAAVSTPQPPVPVPPPVATAIVPPPTQEQRKPKTKAKKQKATKPKPKTKTKGKAKVKPTQKRPSTPQKPKEKSNAYVNFGDYAIHVRPNSGYSHLYRVLARECNFEHVCKQLDEFTASDEKSCAALLRLIFVDRDQFEKKLKMDPAFVAYCKDKTERIKAQASRGIAEAKSVLKNEKRFKNGVWVGNIREMISVCCGSTSPDAKNRNNKKYANAKIAFRQFPRISRGNGKVFLTMFPSKHVAKVNKLIKTVFGDEAKPGFYDYLETKIKQVFG